MADIAVQKYLDKLSGQADPAATLSNVPAAWLQTAAREVSGARQDAKLPRVSDELIEQVTGNERPRDLTGILINTARGIDNHPAAAAAVASGDTVRDVAEQRGQLMAYTSAGAAVQQFGEFGQVAVAQTLDQDLKTFLSTCERVIADPTAPADLRAEANGALLAYQTQIDILDAMGDDTATYRRATVEKIESQIQLSASSQAKLAQVNEITARAAGAKK